MNITLDMTRQYEILSRWRGQKTKPIQTQLKPKQSQYKPNLSKGQNDAKSVYKKDYEEKCGYGPKKTNPIQSQFQTPLFPANTEKLLKRQLLDEDNMRFHQKY